MPRSRRHFEAGHLYEICFRAREGLPFTVTSYMKLLIKAILARTQRDTKVTLCLDVFIGSHPHILAIFKDAEKAKCFYMEVQKKLTDAIKRLLGLDHLNIWEGTPRVMKIDDLESAIRKIAYYYANPAAANLADSIECYAGLSTWQEFIQNKGKLLGSSTVVLPWIRLRSIPKLPSAAVTETQDEHYTRLLMEANKKKTHVLEIFPNAWMQCFGVSTDAEVAKINECIIAKLRHKEEVCRRWRRRKGFKVMSAKELRECPLMAAHKRVNPFFS